MARVLIPAVPHRHCHLQWFDQAVSRAVADGIPQVVLVAAGYDTRAYRLAPIPSGPAAGAEPPVTFYEVHHAYQHQWQ
jgi:hypothetical protein